MEYRHTAAEGLVREVLERECIDFEDTELIIERLYGEGQLGGIRARSSVAWVITDSVSSVAMAKRDLPGEISSSDIIKILERHG